jgi:beta-phosphoglucomutase-like phosphatase (HAD superfamily)
MINTIIFDMNGVIVIDEKYHQLARRKLLKKYNIHSSKEEFKNITLGRTNKEILRYFFKDLSEDDFRKYSNEKTEYAMNLCLPHLTPPAGLIELLDYLYRR